MMKIGLDVGSTTLKCCVLTEADELVYSEYERHFSQIADKAAAMLGRIRERFPEAATARVCVSGSAGMGLCGQIGLPFVQEVFATRLAIKRLQPSTDVAIELGGEDAKILFLSGHMEVRMNGSCAGGTGAFIDQMASLLETTTSGLDELARDSEKVYRVASRCGVFAKSDIQPLLNQGANHADVAASIFAAVVNQTIAGLSQGREIAGHVLYLGGPLTFLPELRKSFDKALNLTGLCPENSLYYVAMGAACSPSAEDMNLAELQSRLEHFTAASDYISCKPLFNDRAEYDAFIERHRLAGMPQGLQSDGANTPVDPSLPMDVYIGIDAGSTTVKAVAVDSLGRMLLSKYMKNGGNCVTPVKDFLLDFYEKYPRATVKGSACTGYGEELVKHAFGVDIGVVETVAHFTAARAFQPEVDFIIDIGGQDIKCFKIRNGAIDNLFLNEACSSGCGSFLQAFAGALGYDSAEFSKLGLFADRPVDLGSRCTVFMNSSVKQAQKDGASIENISAGLSVSVVKNALYKVIRAPGPDSLGKHIVVQGGTFLNDAVLRAFEQEIGREVVRPNEAGLMGAYGAALYAQQHQSGPSTLYTAAALRTFTHTTNAITCKGCSNRCQLTINTFEGGRRYIGGNRCEKPVSGGKQGARYNLYEYKRELLAKYQHTEAVAENPRARIGIPMGLNMYELLPFWYTLLTKLGFEVITSPQSSRKLYQAGQHTIPSDTVCYPAKLMHGHIEALLAENVDAIFYPCMSYNFDEHKGDNHYNCPVVAYYPEVIQANVPGVKRVKFIYDYLGPHNRRAFMPRMRRVLEREFGPIAKKDMESALDAAYAEYDAYFEAARRKSDEYADIARVKGMPLIVLAGRPYHLDPEINHGIDNLICDLGAVVITEDSICQRETKQPVHVLNQWTYHSRLYSSAYYICEPDSPPMNLVQLVSFGCGLDAITTDEVRRILEASGQLYTQIKIDEITNLGAVKIRLRSMLAALRG